MRFETIIKNGTVVDGLGNSERLADVGLAGGEIKAVGNLSRARAKRVLDASGKIVCPGFIDAQNHSDSYLTLLEMPAAESLVSQGITTIAVGQCGSSLSPLATPDALKSIQKWHSLSGANLNWLSFEEYFEALKRYPLGVNVASLVGHSTIRRGLIGDQVRAANPEELAVMKKMIADSLDAGSVGVSLGLVYAHESSASREELVSAANETARADKLYSVHLRSEGAQVVEALREALSLALEAKARLKISHFKIRGEKNWGYLEEALSLVDHAYQQGLDVRFDVYPYTTSWTVLYTYLPKWAYEGGRKDTLRNLSDPTARRKILDYLKASEQDLGSIFIATSDANPALVGKTIHQIAANQEISTEEALLNAVEATETQVVVFDRNLSREGLIELLKHPLSIVATDGAGYDYKFHPLHGLVHPRCFGAMPRFLSEVRDNRLMSWPEAVKKITSAPARVLGIKDRGRLTAGSPADAVVFDPEHVGSRASYENPYQAPDGIEHVFVNGELIVSQSDPPNPPAGRLLRI